MKKRVIISVFAALIWALLLPCTIFASEKSDRAIQISETLQSYRVSPDWAPDLKSNTVLLDELKSLVDNFDQNDVDELGTSKEIVYAYYIKYCDIIGVSARKAPDAQAAAVGSSREVVLEILTFLVRAQVNPEVPGDVAANSSEIERMLMLVFNYTPEECEQTPQSERETITAYLAALYKQKGWDNSELDLLFSSSEYPEQTEVPIPKRKPIPTPIPQKLPQMKDSSREVINVLSSDASLITGILTVLIWVALLIGIIVLLKQRNEKRYHM